MTALLRVTAVALFAAVFFSAGWLTRAAAETPGQAASLVPLVERSSVAVAGTLRSVRAEPTPPASRSEARKPLPKTARPTPSSLGVLRVTAYCWTGNRTASGSWPRLGDAATLDRGIPFGTRLHVGALGTYTVTDRIGHGSDVDLYFGQAGCERRALVFGVRHLTVERLP